MENGRGPRQTDDSIDFLHTMTQQKYNMFQAVLSTRKMQSAIANSIMAQPHPTGCERGVKRNFVLSIGTQDKDLE